VLEAFDDSPETVAQVVQKAIATGQQPGQLYYAFLGNTQRPTYPVPVCWSAAEDMLFENGLMKGDRSSFKKRVKTALVVKLTGKLERASKDSEGLSEYDRTMKVIGAIVDEDTSEDPVVLEAAIKEALPEFQFLDSIKDLLSYGKKREDIGRNICRWWAVPPVLIGWETPGQLGGNEQLNTYVGMMQQEVLDTQGLIQRVFTRLFPNFDWILSNYQLVREISDRQWEMMTSDERRNAMGLPDLQEAEEEPEPETNAMAWFTNFFRKKH